MRIARMFGSDRPVISFEFFPPKTEPGFDALFRTITELKELAPSFVSVTWGAGGSTRRKTVELVARTADRLTIPFSVGGGVRSLDDVRALLRAGADKVSVNSAAVARPELVAETAEKLGSANLIVAIDARRDEAGRRWEVYTHGGRRPTGLDAVEWAARMEALGAGEILLTSMDRDGTRQGYDLEMLRAVADAVPVPVIASGGGGRAEDLAAALDDGPQGGHCQAALAASIFHFREVTVGDVKRRLAELGIPVRPARR